MTPEASFTTLTAEGDMVLDQPGRMRPLHARPNPSSSMATTASPSVSPPSKRTDRPHRRGARRRRHPPRRPHLRLHPQRAWSPRSPCSPSGAPAPCSRPINFFYKGKPALLPAPRHRAGRHHHRHRLHPGLFAEIARRYRPTSASSCITPAPGEHDFDPSRPHHHPRPNAASPWPNSPQPPPRHPAADHLPPIRHRQHRLHLRHHGAGQRRRPAVSLDEPI